MFAQLDPLGFKAGDTNLYRYVKNNPTNYFDPWGLYLIKERISQGLWSGTEITIQYGCDQKPKIVGVETYGSQSQSLVILAASSKASAILDNVETNETKEPCDEGCYISYSFDLSYEVWETLKIGAKPFGIDFQGDFRYRRNDLSGTKSISTPKICCP